MKIVLITDSYPPEIRSASHLMQELAEKLRDNGHEICVVTSQPQYNLSEDLDEAYSKEYSLENGVAVIRVKTLPHHKVNFIIRGLSQLTMPNLFIRKIRKYIRGDIGVVIVYSPPLPLYRVGEVLKKKTGARFILNIQDIFPQNAIDLEVLKNKWLIKFFGRMENKAYDSADQLLVHSEGNKNFLIMKKAIPEDKVSIIHNWVDICAYVNATKTGRFRRQYNLKEDDFVILFAGVIGPSQGLDLIVEAAKKIVAKSKIRFLFIGDGTEKLKLQQMVKKYDLNNITFGPFVSKEQYPDLIKDSDVGLVCLTYKNKTPVVPGKILGYMAAATPILAFLHKQSDGHNLIRQAKCGYTAISDDPDEAVRLIIRAYEQRHNIKQLGLNGAKYVTETFSIEKAAEKLTALF